VPAEPLEVAPVERVLALRTFAPFEGLSPSALSAIAEQVRPRFFRRGSVILHAGVRVRALHFIVSGRVELQRDGRTLGSLGPHDVIGDLAALSQESEGQRAIAAEDSVTLELDRDEMEELFEDSFATFLGVLRVMARQLVHARVELASGGAAFDGWGLGLSAPNRLGLVERILLLRRSLGFAGGEIEALAELAEHAQSVELPAGGRLWDQGESAGDSLILIAGRMRGAADGLELSFSPGSLLGGADALAGEARWYRAAALTPAWGLRLETQHLLDVIEDNMVVGMNLLRLIARGIRSLGPSGGHEPLARG
jgi:CRP-like cAMP-binding protein